VFELYEEGRIRISTVRVTDFHPPFQTAVRHPAYGRGEMIITELYPTIEAARAGHQKWIELMTADELPDQLTDISAAEIGWRHYKKEEG